jgi:hypothetical protein
MSKWLAMFAAVAAVSVTAGCRHTHLGDDTGNTYRRAIAAQRDSNTEAPQPLDADDADKVMRVRRGDKADRKTKSGGGVTVLSTSSASGPVDDSGGSWQGASGNIRLDAK